MLCEEWLIADLCAPSARGDGIYPTASAEEVEHQMRDGGAVVFIAEDQEYVDKILPLADRLPALRHIIVVDETAPSRSRMRSSPPCAMPSAAAMRPGLAGCAVAEVPGAGGTIVYTRAPPVNPRARW